MNRTKPAWLLLIVALFSLHCQRSRPADPARPAQGPRAAVPSATQAASPPAPVSLPGIPIGDGEHSVGAGKVVGNLALFPVYASVQELLGDFLSLDIALAQGKAILRERGNEAPEAPDALPNPAPQLPQQQVLSNNEGPSQRHSSGRGRGGATVGQLMIDNKGELPILVLAGTVVKGGRQDRQVSQDFVVGPREVVAIDAFCVEHGRWNPERNGVDTGGRFQTTKTLANDQVRAAGQYQRDQGRVWSKVGEVNKAHGKSASTGTLMATVDDEALAARRASMARQMMEHLGRVESSASVVGIAYAVEGKVRGVRWFFNHALFEQHGETLVNTAVLDALTAEAVRKSAGHGPLGGACEPAEVGKFIARIEQGQAEQRDTAASNINEVKESDTGYGSSATLKSQRKGGKPRPVTKDFLSK